MITLLWILVPVLAAAGSALLVGYMVRCRAEEVISKERGAIAQLRSSLMVQRQTLERAIRDAKAEARRQALDDFIADFRTEKEYYVRHSRVLFLSRKSVVMRERVLFRNLPLSSWAEHQVTIEEAMASGAFLPAA